MWFLNTFLIAVQVYRQFIYFSSAFPLSHPSSPLKAFGLDLFTFVHMVVFLHIYILYMLPRGEAVVPCGPCGAGQGYDSIVFNPGDGNEIVIWDKHRVKSMRRKAAPMRACSSTNSSLSRRVSVQEVSRDLRSHLRLLQSNSYRFLSETNLWVTPRPKTRDDTLETKSRQDTVVTISHL